MTRRLGKDTQTMADELDTLTTDMDESWTAIKDGIFKAFGPTAREILRGFAENLRWINWYIDSVKGGINYIVDSYNKVKGLIVGTPSLQTGENMSFSAKGKGITSAKNLGFSFDTESPLGPGLQSLKAYTDEMKSSLGELAKEEKDLTKKSNTKNFGLPTM